ncbi:TetR/AcrR family transcriptional regulator [Actinomycetospora sp. CA-101289]|uniref:TetR/AcrR family transcriptional regulator n=1 Tax=Actinomycetospora sp. CA-101289 TaxID=3239893 RepID=UPI003D984A0B
MTRSRSGIYAGRTADERRAERRGRLIAVAMEIWAEQGWAAVTMRGVCARAGLVDRYFYESFADRDALLVAVWDHLRDRVVALVVAAMVSSVDLPPIARLRAAIAAVLDATRTEPEQTRILLGDNAGSAVLEQRRRDILRVFTDLLVDFATPVLRPGASAEGLRMTTLLGVGGFVEVLTAWQAGMISASSEAILDHVTHVATDLAARYLDASELGAPTW